LATRILLGQRFDEKVTRTCFGGVLRRAGTDVEITASPCSTSDGIATDRAGTHSLPTSYSTPPLNRPQSQINFRQILADDDASGEVAGDLLCELVQHPLVLSRTVMGEHERLRIRAGSNFSNGIAACQRVLYDPAEVFVLDFRARHVAAMHQHVGVLRNPIDALSSTKSSSMPSHKGLWPNDHHGSSVQTEQTSSAVN
jgi:hypothetical protein